MKNLVVGFSRAKSIYKIGSKIIQIAEARPFSHAYYRYTCPFSSVEMVSQASHGCINEIPYELFKQDNVIVEEYSFHLIEPVYFEILTFLRKSLGKKYSKLQIAILVGLKLFNIKKEININGDKEQICSEYVARGIKLVEYVTGLPQNVDALTPSELRECIWTNYCAKKNYITKINI